MRNKLHCFQEVWAVDFEFIQPPGERPKPVCLVAHELFTGRSIHQWLYQKEVPSQPPYGVGEKSLFVAYYASAEMNCHRVLGWELPTYVLDLGIEFRNLTNGYSTPGGNGLLGAMMWHGLDCISTAEKERMRELIMSGGPWSEDLKIEILNYCESDVGGLDQLLPVMLPSISLPHALLRGRYMKAASSIEHNGVPVDVPLLEKTQVAWPDIQDQLILDIDQSYGVFEGRTFKQDRFANYLLKHKVPWPRTKTGRLALDDDTFRDMSRAYPEISPLRELRQALSKMRSSSPTIGSDRRNRYMVSPFQSRTGRNQPSTSDALFGSSVWMRGFMQAPPDHAIVYIDWSQQEFGIAAALSGDPRMMDAYASGDPYLEFAKQAGAVPRDATKLTHKAERDRFKACVLAVQYGMSAGSLAHRIGQSEAHAKELLRLHRATYRVFWRWVEGAVDHAMLNNYLHTVYGWTIHLMPGNWPNPRFLQNYLMQANGAEMLRLACCYGAEAGIKICAPVHDAVLIESSVEQLEANIAKMEELMASASEIVLDGFRLRTDVETFQHPGRYMDGRGVEMWNRVMNLIGEAEWS